MGLFDALLGNASETDAQAVAEELASSFCLLFSY